MGFMTEWNRMYDFCMSNRLSKSEILLLHALYMQNNKKDWDAWFEADNQLVQRLTGGLSRQGIVDARNKLKQRGRIDFQDGKKNQKAPLYRMIPFSSKLDIQLDKELDIPLDVQLDVQLDHSTRVDEIRTKEGEPLQKNSPVPYKKIQEMYNRICVGFPKCTVMSEKRKEAVGARFHHGYTFDDFERLFQLAQESDFLKGANKNNWRATFDWLTADANIAKVLDGNYANKGPITSGGPKRGKKSNPSYDLDEFERQMMSEGLTPKAGDG